jgi:glycosyltransferase involved in cell wall biosynthesis
MGKYLEQCFNSLREQTIGIENLQIIFVDDCSKDNSYEILQRYEKEYPESVLVFQLPENRMAGGARNVGLKHVVGEYTTFVDADDWLATTAYEKAYEAVKSHDLDVVQYGHISVCQGQEQEVNCGQCGYIDGSDDNIKKTMILGYIFTFGCWNKLYRTSLMQQVNARYTENTAYEETSFVFPMLAYGERFYQMKEGLYYYRIDNPSITRGYIRKNNKLYDHPNVQLDLLKKMVSDKKFVSEYYQELELYFLKTYYIETIYFAGLGLYLDVEFFAKMQNIVKKAFPEYYNNPYLSLDRTDFKLYKGVLESLVHTFTQDELTRYCKEFSKKWESHHAV